MPKNNKHSADNKSLASSSKRVKKSHVETNIDFNEHVSFLISTGCWSIVKDVVLTDKASIYANVKDELGVLPIDIALEDYETLVTKGEKDKVTGVNPVEIKSIVLNLLKHTKSDNLFVEERFKQITELGFDSELAETIAGGIDLDYLFPVESKTTSASFLDVADPVRGAAVVLDEKDGKAVPPSKLGAVKYGDSKLPHPLEYDFGVGKENVEAALKDEDPLLGALTEQVDL